jgi:hypothetical protein
MDILAVLKPQCFNGLHLGSSIRSLAGESVIGKPVDLEIATVEHRPRVAVAIEVANVNRTQLVGEASRLFFNHCPRKLLVLGDRNVPPGNSIENTPARVASYSDDEGVAPGT